MDHRREQPIAYRLLHHATTAALTRAQNTAFLGGDRRYEDAEPSIDASPVGFVGILPVVKQVIIASSIGTFLLATSVILYAVFYIMIMPGYNASARIYFDHSGIANHPATVPADPGFNITDTLSYPTSKNEPWAVADLFSKHSHWEAFHTECSPKLITEQRLLKSGHSYYMEISLDIPESDINRRSGIFNVMVELQSSNGTKLATSVRSSRIPHETFWISNVRKSILLIPLMIGAAQESKTVIIPSFRHFVEIPEFPLRYITVRLIRGEKEGTGFEQHPLLVKPLEITTGEIRIGQELSDFQLFLKEWFFTAGSIGTCFFFLFQLCLLASFYGLIEMRRRRQILVDLDDASDNLVFDDPHVQQSDSVTEDLDWDEANEVPIHGTHQPSNANSQDSPDNDEGARPRTPSLDRESTPATY